MRDLNSGGSMTGAPRGESYMFDPAAETMPRGDLAALQLTKLRRTVERAYEAVPAVRRKFDAAGARPEHVKTLADLARFPFSTKGDLRDNFPFGLFAVPREQLIRIHGSSGTTGKPTVVGYTRGDLDVWSSLMARSLASMGARPGDLFHNAFGYGLFTGGLGYHYGAERLGLTVVPVSGGGTERQVTLIQDLRPRILGATPSYALNIAEVAQRMGVDLRRLSLRFAACGAEPWSEAMRRDLEGKLGIKAMDSYGLSEIIGPGVANECHEAQDGLHVWEDHFLCEVLDPETMEPVKPGETRRARHHDAHQGSAADDPLPHARPHAPAGGALHLRPHPPAHDAGHRPHRRHADRARRQRLSVADRGASGRFPRSSRRTTSSSSRGTGRCRP